MKRQFGILFYLGTVLLILGMAISKESAMSDTTTDSDTTTITILFTNSSNGRLRACPTCPNLLYGGMPRRASVIKEYRSKYKNILLLDSGDLFPVLAPKEQVEYVIKTMNLMGYDAMAIGDQEFMYGKEFLQDMMQKAIFPFLSATIATKEDSPAFSTKRSGQPRLFATPYIIKEISGLKVLITGVVGEKAFLFFPKEKIEGLTILNPVLELKKILSELKDKVDYVIVLSHLGDVEDQKLAQEVDGIDLIIGGHTQTLIEKPLRVRNTVIVQAGKNGEHIGELKISIRKTTKAEFVQFPGQTTYILLIRKKDSTIMVAEHKLVLLDQKIPDDPEVSDVISEYETLLEEIRLARAKPQISSVSAETYTLGRALPFILIPSEIELGTMEKGKILETEVQLKNIGSDTLVIKRIRSSCDCLEASLTGDIIPPQESSSIKLKFFSSEVLGETFTYNLYIESNDITQQISNVFIEGRVTGIEKEVAPVIPRREGLRVAGKFRPRINAPGQVRPIKLPVMFFYSPGCHQCEEIKNGLLPSIRIKYTDAIEIREYDISKKENYELLVALEEKYRVKQSAPVEVFVGDKFLLGSREIKGRLENIIEEILKSRAVSSVIPVAAGRPEIGTGAIQAETESRIVQRFRSFGPFAIIVAGLLDGINPCAFATIIFFISFLGYAGRSRRDVLLTGVFFAAGVFCAYFLLGIGLFKFLQSISVFKVISAIIFYAIFALTLSLGCLSLYDAYIYRKSKDASRIALQLPRSVKENIHFWIRKNINTPAIVTGAFTTGLLISLLEAVCTGQIYVPTLTFMTKEPALAARAYLYLFLYNLMFIVPLIIVFLLAFWGVGSQRLAQFSQKNVIPVKILTAVFFFGLAALLIILR